MKSILSFILASFCIGLYANQLVVFENFTLIDGTGTEPIKDAVIVINGERILYAGARDNFLEPKIAKFVDLDNSFVLPGLIDTHVHLAGSGEPDSQFEALDRKMLWKMIDNAEKNLAAGFTTIRDLGGWNGIEFEVRALIESGLILGPRMILAGRYISVPDQGESYYKGMYRVVKNPGDLIKAVKEQVSNGADVIKMGVTGAVLVPNGEPSVSHFSLEEIKTLVKTAKEHNKPVAVHAHGIDGISKAVLAGVDTIEHGTYLYQDPKLIEIMKSKNITLVPTLKIGYCAHQRTFVPEWIKDKSSHLFKTASLSLEMAYKTGVNIAMGSDAGTPNNYHGQNTTEIYLMHQAGLSPMDAILAATRNAARALKIDSVGILKAGNFADFIVHKENPLENLQVLSDKNSLQLVIKNGKIVASGLKRIPKELLGEKLLIIGSRSKL
jgi:imidazolonepropionase-like amidohydrolase